MCSEAPRNLNPAADGVNWAYNMHAGSTINYLLVAVWINKLKSLAVNLDVNQADLWYLNR
jgi:hypothetical protein